MEENQKINVVFNLVETVWASGLRCADADDIELIHSLNPKNVDRPALEGALDFLGVLEMWNNAGRPAFGKFSLWWTPVFHLIKNRRAA